jgi:hypothetical protein
MGEVLRIAPAPIVKEVQPVDDAVADVDPALAGGDVDPALDGGNVDPALDGGNVDPAGVDGVDSQPAPLAPRTMAAYTGAAAISQGVSLVGVGPRNTLLERSRECGVDVLLVVRVSSLLTAKGQLNTSIEMELVDGQSGNMLKKSKEVNNLEYFFAKENPRAKDPVEESLDDFFKYVAENLQLQAMPELQPVHAAGRVGVIVAEERPKPLSLLAEMLYYRNQKLISDEQLAAACGKLIGEAEGKQLVSGRPEEKKFVLDRLLNSHVSSGVEPGEIDFFAEPASSGE